ncbi:hypothetical protein [Comamonas sp. B21-038]|uniref:hypothetical protein n=1 Tax=Comamonas sp. B21-038 TaxID=2918299 RepID=UPI001EFA59BA|nr:hypothetical protein [Comamonas sp. B21-038]ULR87410.1 hypothetical protein MJ205_13140 [Comamonas sp. B21-038]
MIYSPANVDRAAVYDVDRNEKFEMPLLVNTGTGSVVVAKLPLRLNHKGKVDRETIHFDSIHPIYGGGIKPCLFHCYGRRP